MAKYDFGQMEEFADKLPQQDRTHFQVILQEGKLVTRSILQAGTDSVDTSLCILVTEIIIRRES